MARVSSKLQITIPKWLAERYGITPGDSVSFQEAGEGIRLVPTARRVPSAIDRSQRLALFDASTQRQRDREAQVRPDPAHSRGWTREELYRRGSVD